MLRKLLLSLVMLSAVGCAKPETLFERCRRLCTRDGYRLFIKLDDTCYCASADGQLHLPIPLEDDGGR